MDRTGFATTTGSFFSYVTSGQLSCQVKEPEHARNGHRGISARCRLIPQKETFTGEPAHRIDIKLISLKAAAYECGSKCDSTVRARMPVPPR